MTRAELNLPGKSIHQDMSKQIAYFKEEKTNKERHSGFFQGILSILSGLVFFLCLFME